jgi:Ca-activated chloride channel family protein
VSFLWPDALWLLLVLPVLAVAYVLMLRFRKAARLRFSNLSLVREALGGRQYRRHVPPVLLLIGLGALFVAISRPQAVVRVPGHKETIILAMDVSASMQATDVVPSRVIAAQRAAKAFVATMPAHVHVGVVSFAGSAALVQTPTLDHGEIDSAIDRLQLGPSTNLHAGIALSLAALFPHDGIELEHFTDGGARVPFADIPTRRLAPVEPGSYRSGAIVLLTDGQRTMGRDPMEAAQWAAERGVRVYTVGLGTAEGSVINVGGWSIRVRIDEETLKQVARMTGAKYFNVDSAEALQTVYAGLGNRLASETKETELTGFIALMGALFVALASVLSLAWFGIRA